MRYWLLITSLVIILLLVLMITWLVWYHPNVGFAPVNYWLSKDATLVKDIPYFTEEVMDKVYPDYKYAQQHYMEIKGEVIRLWESLKDPAQNYLDKYHLDLGDANTNNWTTIPLRVFGRDYLDYQKQCPVTSSLMQRCNKIRSCIFSIMAPGKVIEPHYGPYHGLIRYQLPLMIPTSGECFLTVDGIQHYWEEGKSILFDETYLHSASNLTDQWRIVLLMDFPRPYRSELRQLASELVTSGMGWVS